MQMIGIDVQADGAFDGDEKGHEGFGGKGEE